LQYPEKIPTSNNSLDKFTFSLNASKSLLKELENELESLDSRIDRISNDVLVGGLPIIRFILQSSHDKKELKILAKAVNRIADIIEQRDKVDSKITIIQTAEKDPEWFALAFGDFSQEIENDISTLINNKD
jgi:archaellum component FlaC